MQRGITLNIFGQRIQINFDPVQDVLSFHYKHHRQRKPALIQEFPLSHTINHEAVWDTSSARFVLVPKKKPAEAVSLNQALTTKSIEPARPNDRAKNLARASGDYIFWSDL